MIPKIISVDSNTCQDITRHDRDPTATRLRVQHDLRRGGGDQKQEERGGAGEGDHHDDGWRLTNADQEQSSYEICSHGVVITQHWTRASFRADTI